AGRRAVAAGVRDDDDLELQAFGSMDRQQPDDVGVLLLGDGLELLRTGLVLFADEADEALDVCAAQLFVGSREPAELAQVCVAAAAVPLRQHRKVVVVRRYDLLAETVRPQGPRRGPRAA